MTVVAIVVVAGVVAIVVGVHLQAAFVVRFGQIGKPSF